MTSPPSFKQKILGSGEAVSAAVTRLPRPRVFTNGCFDLLHLGHVSYLEAARRLGAALIVGINTDRSVRLLQKGHERPINPLRDRAAVIAALAAVDLVVAFDEATPLRLIQEVMPDILVKGGDWALSDIVGADWVKQQGGDVKTIACEFERSTTSLIAKLRRGG